MSQNVSHPSRFQPKSEHSARKKPSPAGARLISILSIALLLFALVSCRSSSVQTPNSQDQQGYDATGDSRIQDDQLNQQNDSSPEPAEITFETVPSPDDPQQTFGVVTAYDADRQELWTYQTATVQEAQIAQNTSLGHHGDRYYILEDRHIVALNIQDGSVVWKNSETFTAPSVAFADDSICVSSIVSPEFAAISYDGATLKTIDSLDPGASWEGAISRAGSETAVSGSEATITVTDSAENQPFLYYVDLNTYEVRKGQDTPAPENVEPSVPDSEPAAPSDTGTTVPNTEPVPPENEPPVQTSAAWKQAYADYVQTNGYSDLKFALIDLDQNGIPELYVTGASHAEGDMLCTWSESGLADTLISMDGLGYLPGENLFRDCGWWQDFRFDSVYTIQNGKFVELHYGTCYEGLSPEDSQIELDNTTLSSAEEYEAQLNAVYDTTREVHPSYDSYLSYNELLQAMENY